MRPLHVPRKSARLVTVAAASCATAMLALTGCGGDDDKGGPAIPPPSMPAMPSLKPLTLPPLTIETSGSSKPSTGGTAAGAPTAPKPSAGSTKLGPGDLTTVGVCLGKSASGSLIKASCTEEHVGEVAAIFTLPESMNPSTATYKEDIRAKCQELLLPILNRQPNAGDLAPLPSGPTEKSWAEDKDRTLSCIVTTKGNVKLNAPLVK
ncbi:hypothetical protein [Yinghuangia sp. YIM S10712]|uniref:hypothetical protein n=1 Tax=Yinghuangia sp. YIM S10712 TaxID=3436930 RepID=UPI003F536C97